MSEYEIQIVVTVNKEEEYHLADHMVIHVCSAQTDDENNIIDAEINNIEANILKFVSNLNTQQLKSIIYMSLDMDVKIGHPDKLMADVRL